jgi:N-dimethylarginine dimethylaminohydrolase
MSNFAALVHVSTAFVHACNHNTTMPNQLISGAVSLSFDHTVLLSKLRAKTRDEIERETPDLLRRLGGWPNTCVFLICTLM